MSDLHDERIAVITRLAEKSSGNFNFGRTALMKFCYFLQTLRDVPLGYHFTLYSYGPFDSDVLADLDTAEGLGTVQSTVVYYPGGYRYEIKPPDQSRAKVRLAADFLEKYEQDIDCVVNEFKGLNSAALELAGTIVYVDREAASGDESLKIEVLVQRVKDVKPRFSEGQIRNQAENLSEKSLLCSIL